jgi:hypothetical protein
VDTGRFGPLVEPLVRASSASIEDAHGLRLDERPLCAALRRHAGG